MIPFFIACGFGQWNAMKNHSSHKKSGDSHVRLHYNIAYTKSNKNINKNKIKRNTYLRINFIFTALTYAACTFGCVCASGVAFLFSSFFAYTFFWRLVPVSRSNEPCCSFVIVTFWLPERRMRGYYLFEIGFKLITFGRSISIFTNGTRIKSIWGGDFLRLMMIKPHITRVVSWLPRDWGKDKLKSALHKQASNPKDRF